jgi:hypothetical protein
LDNSQIRAYYDFVREGISKKIAYALAKGLNDKPKVPSDQWIKDIAERKKLKKVI